MFFPVKIKSIVLLLLLLNLTYTTILPSVAIMALAAAQAEVHRKESADKELLKGRLLYNNPYLGPVPLKSARLNIASNNSGGCLFALLSTAQPQTAASQ